MLACCVRNKTVRPILPHSLTPEGMWSTRKQAGLLTLSSSHVCTLPAPAKRAVDHKAKMLPYYSGGTVTELHRASLLSSYMKTCSLYYFLIIGVWP